MQKTRIGNNCVYCSLKAHTGRKTTMATIDRACGNILNITEERVNTASSILPAYPYGCAGGGSPDTVASVEVSC